MFTVFHSQRKDFKGQEDDLFSVFVKNPNCEWYFVEVRTVLYHL